MIFTLFWLISLIGGVDIYLVLAHQFHRVDIYFVLTHQCELMTLQGLIFTLFWG